MEKSPEEVTAIRTVATSQKVSAIRASLAKRETITIQIGGNSFNIQGAHADQPKNPAYDAVVQVLEPLLVEELELIKQGVKYEEFRGDK